MTLWELAQSWNKESANIFGNGFNVGDLDAGSMAMLDRCAEELKQWAREKAIKYKAHAIPAAVLVDSILEDIGMPR